MTTTTSQDGSDQVRETEAKLEAAGAEVATITGGLEAVDAKLTGDLRILDEKKSRKVEIGEARKANASKRAANRKGAEDEALRLRQEQLTVTLDVEDQEMVVEVRQAERAAILERLAAANLAADRARLDRELAERVSLSQEADGLIAQLVGVVGELTKAYDRSGSIVSALATRANVGHGGARHRRMTHPHDHVAGAILEALYHLMPQAVTRPDNYARTTVTAAEIELSRALLRSVDLDIHHNGGVVENDGSGADAVNRSGVYHEPRSLGRPTGSITSRAVRAGQEGADHAA